METFISQIRQFPARLLIYGVLLGLLFSSGEGIQLLPFPGSTEGNVSKTAASSRERLSKSYAFSVSGSRSPLSLQKSKFQKDAHSSLSGARLTPDPPEASAGSRSPAAVPFSRADVLHFALVTRWRPKRAPPLM